MLQQTKVITRHLRISPSSPNTRPRFEGPEFACRRGATYRWGSRTLLRGQKVTRIGRLVLLVFQKS